MAEKGLFFGESYKEMFLKNYPRVKKDSEGYPSVCMRSLFGYDAEGPDCHYGGNCKKCWDYVPAHNAPYATAKKCLFFTADDYRHLIKELFGDDAEVGFSYEGIYYFGPTEIADEDVLSKIGEKYGVEVTSIHIDDCDYIGVWVCYKTK